MTSTFSPNINLNLQGTGDASNTWGAVLNSSVFTNIDTAMGGAFAISVAGNTDYTLSATNALNLYHILSGVLTGNINYVFPASAGRFVVIYNNTSGAFTVTVKQSGGTGIVIPQGKRMFILLDANTTTALAAFNWLSTLTLGTPSSAAGTLTFYNATNSNTLVLQPGATGSNLTFTMPIADGTNGQLLTTNGSGVLSFTSPAGSGTVTSVTYTGDGVLQSSTPSSAVTTSGSLTASLRTQTANTILCGPTTGSAANPTFRALVAADLPSGGAAVATVKTQKFTVNGTYTPSTGMIYCIAEVLGAGGGGGGANSSGNGCSGGGAGAYGRSVLSAATIGSSQIVTIGAKGAAGANTGGDGGTGGTSSLGSIISCTGGLGGKGVSSTTSVGKVTPGTGGTCTGGDLAITGNSGGLGLRFSASDAFGGEGANSQYGSGGIVNTTSGGAPGSNASGYGAGGAGANALGAGAGIGGTGSDGIIYITEFCSQ